MTTETPLWGPCETAAAIARMHPPGERGLPCDEFGQPTTYRIEYQFLTGSPDTYRKICIASLGDEYGGKAQALPLCSEHDAAVDRAYGLLGAKWPYPPAPSSFPVTPGYAVHPVYLDGASGDDYPVLLGGWDGPAGYPRIEFPPPLSRSFRSRWQTFRFRLCRPL